MTECVDKDQVFCESCEYLVQPSVKGRAHNCCHRLNIMKEHLVTWLAKETAKSYIKEPSTINKNNDCKWYKRDNSRTKKEA